MLDVARRLLQAQQRKYVVVTNARIRTNPLVMNALLLAADDIEVSFASAATRRTTLRITSLYLSQTTETRKMWITPALEPIPPAVLTGQVASPFSKARSTTTAAASWRRSNALRRTARRIIRMFGFLFDELLYTPPLKI